MIRDGAWKQKNVVSLPRMRGDDPQLPNSSRAMVVFAPHARG